MEIHRVSIGGFPRSKDGPALSNPVGTIIPLGDLGTPAALFDLDRTLIPGSSLVHVGRVAVRCGLVSPLMLMRGLVEDARFRTQGSSDDQVGRLHKRLLAMAEGVEADRGEELAEMAAPAIVRDVRPRLRRVLDDHLQQGHVCVVLSASPDEVVREVARRLGADLGLGTRAEVADGRYTGRLRGEPCYGPGKMLRLDTAALPIDLRTSYAYADSSSDLPVLEAVGHPVAVRPDKRLRAVAEERGWVTLGDEGERRVRRRARAAA